MNSNTRTQLLEFSLHEIASMNRDPINNDYKEETPRDFFKNQNHKEEHENSTNPNSSNNAVTP